MQPLREENARLKNLVANAQGHAIALELDQRFRSTPHNGGRLRSLLLLSFPTLSISMSPGLTATTSRYTLGTGCRSAITTSPVAKAAAFSQLGA